MNIVVSKRYRVAEKLGAGGMGEVYRAFDRMRGEDVALKRVLIEPEQLHFQSVHVGGDPRTLLAQEFRLLASMRHPNIISVLDYGVDGARQPFFTMTLLRDAIPLHNAANDLRSRTRQFLQVIRALEYLHRRGVIHRDLKPNNILVDVDGQVRVLDFGLALETEGDEHLSGTLAYMAPETLASKLTVPASDVHALGVMFYEAITGQHPFFHKSMASMMRKIISELPSESALRACLPPGYDALGDLIMACLDKDPVSRYERFEQHRDKLIRLAGEETTLEPTLFRESFLQSARFVGRRDEYTQLVDGLGVTASGTGSAWLIGGESGVGKSRLIDEVRIAALVKGFLVLRAEVVSSGAFALWGAVGRQLALEVEIDDVEASVLKLVAPDIETLIERHVPELPVLPAQNAADRLVGMIAALITRAGKPTLLIVDDLHLVPDELAPLRTLITLVNALPLLIVAGYRSDEAPHLPESLPGARGILLERLSRDGIAELSGAMIGHGGMSAPVVELLEKETEGNIFLLIEAVRALAEEAGDLANIARSALPARIFTGGMVAFVQRRLERVPPIYFRPLQAAALVGRQIDLPVLALVFPDLEVEAWLYACAELAVLEVRDDAWRFGHDKLREALLAGMTLDEQQMWSRAVASALETIYGRDPLHAGQIADLWFAVGEAARSLDYALIAARHMIDISAQYDRAAELIMRALAAQPELALRAHLLGLLSETKEKRMQLDAAYADSEVALTLAREANDPALIADTLIGLGNVFFAQSRYDDARGKYAEAETLIAQLNDERREANVVMRLGSVLRMQGQFADARAHFQRSLALYEAQGAEQWIGMIQNALGVCAMEQGNHDAALDHYERSQAISERIGDLRQRAATLNNITIVLINRGSFDSALDYSRRSLEIAQRIGYRNAILAVLNNLTSATYAQRNYELSAEYARETLALAREFGDRRVEAMALANLGSSLNAQRQFEAARDSMEAALALFRDMNHRFGMSIMLSNLGEIYGNLGETARAVRCVRESLHLAVEVNSQTRKVAAIYAAARLLWSHFDQQMVAAWVWFGRRLPEIGQEMRDHYDELRAQIERERSDLVDVAEAASQQLDLAAVVEQIEAVLETYTREL